MIMDLTRPPLWAVAVRSSGQQMAEKQCPLRYDPGLLPGLLGPTHASATEGESTYIPHPAISGLFAKHGHWG